jgi:hypothetical protein
MVQAELTVLGSDSELLARVVGELEPLPAGMK